MRHLLCAVGFTVAAALTITMLFGTSTFANAASAETAAEAAKKPVRAPEPYRLADGHPNWDGFWAPLDGLLNNNIGLGGSVPGAPPPISMFPFAKHAALKEQYKDEVIQYKTDLRTGKIPDLLAQCLPPGMPDMMIALYGMEVLETSGAVAITSESNAESRRIWLKKEHTPLDELIKSYTGESIGHWEGDSLIVDTIGIRTDIRMNGLMGLALPHSEKAHLVETFTETKPGILEDKMFFDDPEVFEAPWTQVLTYRYRPDLRLEEYVCLENNRNVDDKGKAVFDK